MNYYKLGNDFNNETILNIAPKINRLAENKQYKALKAYMEICMDEVDNLLNEYKSDEIKAKELREYKLILDEQILATDMLIELNNSKRKRKNINFI